MVPGTQKLLWLLTNQTTHGQERNLIHAARLKLQLFFSPDNLFSLTSNYFLFLLAVSDNEINCLVNE